jgi:hypothetical protein
MMEPKNEKQGGMELHRNGYQGECGCVTAMRQDDKSHDLWAVKLRTRNGNTGVVLLCDGCAEAAERSRVGIVEWRVKYKLATEDDVVSGVATVGYTTEPVSERGKEVAKKAEEFQKQKSS